MLNVKQGGIKDYFLCLRHDSTWSWTSVSRAIGERKLVFVNLVSDLIDWLIVFNGISTYIELFYA